MLKMSSAIDAAFFLSISPFVVNLSPFFIQRRGKVCLSIDFLFVTQYLVHSNDIINVFTYFIYIQPELPPWPCQSFLVVLARAVPYVAEGKKWKYRHVLDRNRTPLHMEP